MIDRYAPLSAFNDLRFPGQGDTAKNARQSNAATPRSLQSTQFRSHDWRRGTLDALTARCIVFSYAIGSRKLSANEPFFVGAQTVFVTNN